MRLPDFVMVGMMKAGTTTLYEWISAHPQAQAARKKEVHYFTRYWDRDLRWYSSWFDHVPPNLVVGEASTSYTRPAEGGDEAAARMAATLPDVRLLCLLRDPVERLRSHYRHDLRKGRTRAGFLDAVREPANPYVAVSLYHQRLAPYLDAFAREQLCVVRLEDLVDPGGEAWSQVLAHVGLPPSPRPTAAHNVGAGRPAYGRLLGRVNELRPWRYRRAYRAVGHLPAPVRRAAKAVLVRDPERAAPELDAAGAPLPADVAGAIWADVERLEAALGIGGTLWPRAGS